MFACGPAFFCPTINQPFDPASLFTGGIGGVFWDFTDPNAVYSTSSRTTLATAGGSLGSVTDKSGNGRHLAASGSSPITWNNVGGLGYGDFPGTTNSMGAISGSVNTIGGSAGWEAFCAFRPANTTTLGSLIDMDALSSRVAQGPIVNSTSIFTLTFNSDGSNDPGLGGGTLVAASDYVTAVERSPTFLHIRLNKSQVATLAETKNPAEFTAGGIQVGSAYEGTSTPAYRPYYGRIYAALIISRLLTTAERDNLETWMYAHANL